MNKSNILRSQTIIKVCILCLLCLVLAALFLNIQSLLRFRPFIRKERIKIACSSLIDGYFSNNRELNGLKKDDFINGVLFLFSLGYYVGYQTDRPLYKIYRQNLGWRYATMLHRQLLRGSADVT